MHTLWLPLKLAARQTLRLQEQIPLIMDILLNAPKHKCEHHGALAYQGSRIPRCGCRFHAYQWLVLNMERYTALRRPFMSYVATGQPVPPWFQRTRRRRNFGNGVFRLNAGEFYPAKQAVNALAI